MESAVHVVSYSRENREEALAMTLWRQPALARTGPETVREEALHINDDYFSVTRALVARRYGRVTPHRMELVTAACQAVPYGLVRPHLAEGTPIPDWLDDVARAAAGAILDLGDREP